MDHRYAPHQMSVPTFRLLSQKCLEKFNLAFLGSAGVGKTAIMYRFLGHPLQIVYVPDDRIVLPLGRHLTSKQMGTTIADSYSIACDAEGHHYRLNLLDTGGEDEDG